jgi:mannose-6-phosphate isomerase-like protein (cupin superfamily)
MNFTIERWVSASAIAARPTLAAAALVAFVVLCAQGAVLSAQEQEYDPTCDSCPATYIPSEEVQAYVTRAIANQFTDQQIRQVDAGKTNLGIGVVYRGQRDDPQSNVAEHDLVSEVYYVIDGEATLVVGPDLIGKERRPSTQRAVSLINGPGNDATGIRNGVAHELKAGDMVIIPAGTGHQFTRIEDHITYVIVRIDPDKVTLPKTEAESKADLATDGRATAGSGAGAVGSGREN